MTNKKAAGAPKAADRVAPEFTPARTDIAKPQTASAGGKRRSAIAVAMEAMEINTSIGIKNKTRAQVSTQVSKFNNHKDNLRIVKGEDGSPIMVDGADIKDKDGNTVGKGAPVPKTERIKEFSLAEVDPATDPDGAQVRIFRDK